MSKKTIWIINQYSSLPSTGMGGRHRHLSRELAALGYKVTLISARWTHGTRDEKAADQAPELECFEGFQFLRIPVSKYKHAHDKKRVLNWFAFAFRTIRLPKTLKQNPDYIIYSSPSLIGYLSAFWLAKKFDAKLIFEVRDIWPLTLTQIGGFSPRHPFIKFMQWIEDFAYKRSDHVMSNLEGAVEHAKSRGLNEQRFSWIPNGFSKQEVNQVQPATPEISTALSHQPFSVSYTGAMGEANSLDTLINAADSLKGFDNIHFNVFGRGRLEDALKEQASELKLDRVHFWGAVSKEQVQSVLKASDVCVICWKKSPLYDHGLAANKIFDYMCSGRPVINAYSGGYDVVSRYKAGLTIEAESPSALSGAIVDMYNKAAHERELMGENGRKAANDFHEYQQLSKKLAGILSSL